MRRLWKRFFRQIIKSFNLELRRSFHGTRIKTPVIGGTKVGIHTEEWMLELLRELFVERPGAFIDIGANLGQTLIKVKHLSPDREYVGFEPNPFCVVYLNQLVQCNHYRATIVPVGVGDRDEILRLVFYADHVADPTASLIPNFRNGRAERGAIMVPVFRFEKLLKSIQEKVAIVKIDVEGAELEVLEGMTDFLKTQAPLVLFEILPVRSMENKMRWDRQTRIESLFKSLNYTLFRVRKNEAGAYEGLDKITAFEIHDDLNRCDYVGVPPSQEAAFV